ncbi:MAG: agmatinase [Eubacteriales bacterium]
MLDKNIQTFLTCDREYKEAGVVLFGAPFDGTTSFRPGTRFGPNAIRSESFGIETYSPYQDRDLVDMKICDIGDLDFPFGNTRRVLDMIKETTAEILADEKLPVMLGGEHLITLGAFEAVVEKYPNVHVIHLDAHTDLREEYLGEELSHSAVIKRVWDIIGDDRIYQFGIRSGEKYEFEFAKEHTIMQKFNLEGFSEVVEKLKGKPVYFTLDLDILDPSIFSGTGTPEAGGVTYMELQNAVMQLKELNIVGCDINELAPSYDASGVSTAVACKITREIMLALK